MFRIVVAHTKKFGIGFKNTLPWRIPKDMEHFVNLTKTTEDQTKRNAVIMGKNTWLSIPEKNRPLKNRFNIILSSTMSPQRTNTKDTLLVPNLSYLLNNVHKIKKEHNIENFYVAGGSQVYHHFLNNNCVSHIHSTEIQFPQDPEIDTYFPLNLQTTTDFKLIKKTAITIVENKNHAHLPEEKTRLRFQTYINNQNPQEQEYLELLSRVMTQGRFRDDRTNTGTLSLFAPQSLRFSLKHDIIPLLTTKHVSFRVVAKELLWFLSGKTDTTILSKDNVHIWDGNSSQEFLDNQNLPYKQGDIGPGYGFQWRHFNAPYTDCNQDYTNQGVDQIANVIHLIKTNPTSRRIYFTAWNPQQIPEMALPPCHLNYQFYVDPKHKNLSCHMYMRSTDLFLGLPYNIASTSLLTHMIAKLTDLTPYEIIISFGDAHIYQNHIEQVKIQLSRVPTKFPILSIKPPTPNNHQTSIDDFEYSDFQVQNYHHQGRISAQMAV